ncbi:DUF881 domain-containing protein [Isachenkonia alkalipeptolytica]|uniref:DUF881 domain-containing protein n=1 Tax=Isachenkonia alkalipeptolytica TaxID=2565777 RepID=A0AA43XKX7_9CLOT|nr:DUF881 domain-containing protein [Isachenkonia alkalipeptolytica]NBG88522.1 DUF881 domain-containing protein [Isachenkonia alkalipeptolytica]
MKDVKSKIILGLLSMLVVFSLSVQFQTIRDTTGGELLSTQRSQAMAIELRNLQEEREQLTKELTDLENRLQEYEQTDADENLIIQNLRRDLQRYQLISGHVSGQGPGVVITIESEEEEGEFLLYNYDILLSLANNLNAAGAEAIEINGERYTALTEIYYGSNAIHVNDRPISPPFEIRAIGHGDTLEAALNIRYGIIWEIRQFTGINVEITKEDNIFIERAQNISEFEYAVPLAEDEQ